MGGWGRGAVKALFATVRRGPQCKANTNVASVGFPARDGAVVKAIDLIVYCDTLQYHWRELPQVSFLSRQNTCLSRQNTSFVATKVGLSRQTYFCRNTTLAATNICRDKQFCHDKSFVATSLLLSRRNSCLSRQKTWFVATSMCFVATNTCSWRQT